MFMSPYIIVFVVAWFVAQGAKYILQLHNNKAASFKTIITESGGMPSSHSAVVVAVTTLIMLKEGLASPVFGIALTFAMIVIYDSMKVRYSTGQQSIAINKIIDQQKLKIPKLRVVKGNTPLEAAVGSSLGLFIGYLAFIVGL
jgi:acid phosphatase family membrane protein YuiD